MNLDPILYDKLTSYCAYSERCASDVKEKCKKLSIEKTEIPDYISLLEKQGFLDEFRYAKTFIESKINRKWGFNKIKVALQLKGLKNELFMPFFEAIEKDVLLENIKVLSERKLKSIKGETPSEIKQKLVRFLMSKGYSYDLIKEALADFVRN